jgi:hypothetical protein
VVKGLSCCLRHCQCCQCCWCAEPLHDLIERESMCGASRFTSCRTVFSSSNPSEVPFFAHHVQHWQYCRSSCASLDGCSAHCYYSYVLHTWIHIEVSVNPYTTHTLHSRVVSPQTVAVLITQQCVMPYVCLTDQWWHVQTECVV